MSSSITATNHESDEPTYSRTGSGFRFLWDEQLSVSIRREANYKATANLREKVLDFIQFGGPDLTVGRTIFEMWLGL